MFMRIALLCLLPIFLFNCAKEKRIVEIDPTAFPDLRGYVNISQKEYLVGEEIPVEYWLTNTTEQKYQENIIDGSLDKSVAFQSYNFNAVSPIDKEQRLQLEKASAPLSGVVDIAPGDKKLFTKNTFRATGAGSYVLTMTLYWKNQKKINFTPVTIKIISPQQKKEELDEDLQKNLVILKQKDFSEREKAIANIKARGAKVIPKLIKLLDNEDTSIRSEITSLILKFEEEAIPHLVKAAKDKNREIRMRVIFILGEMGDVKALNTLSQALLKDEDKDIRYTAMRSINKNFIDQIVVPLMVIALADEDLQIREAALDSLRTRTGENFGFEPDASENKRKAAIEKWKDWGRQKYSRSIR
jgi:hypothetical protein